MANLAQKNGTWLVRFRFLGKEFKRSLKTSNEREATAAQHAVEWTIHRLETGQLQLPADVEAGDFIVSGGLLQQPLRIAAPVDFPSTKSLIERYLDNSPANGSAELLRESNDSPQAFHEVLGTTRRTTMLVG